jgi:glycosyltransferase involved in cell wall biosynthesis
VIYVDSCSPQPWSGHLDSLAAEGKITLIRAGFHLSQHEAFNLAVPHVRTKYVTFIDNDILLTPGWAENLVTCAEETGASAVMPIVEEREKDRDWHIHMCGGDCGVEERDGQLWFREIHPLHGQAKSDLQRCQTGVVEYHALLVRNEALQKVGPFDESYWPALDHTDFSLMIRASGGTLWIEPSSVVRYGLPPPLEFQDLSFFMTRWNDDLVRLNQQHFAKKWGVQFSPNHALWYSQFRRRDLYSIRAMVRRRFGSFAGKTVYRFLCPVEAFVSRIVQAWNRVPNRRQRLEALGSWRAPELDRARVQAFADTIFRSPRPLQRELVVSDESIASSSDPNATVPT